MKRMTVLMLFAASAFAQQLSETVNVEVIQVPVYVVAADGTPVRGLKKDDFELFIDGFPKPIEYFDPVDVATKVDEPRPERERRLYLLLFDLSCSRDDCRGLPGRIARAQKGAAAAVEASNLDSDLFAVATYTMNHGVQFATPFLRDRAAVHRAISTLSVSAMHDPLGLAISKAEQMTWLREQTADVTDQALAMLNSRYDLASRELATAMIGGIANQDNVREPIKHMVEDQFANLGSLAARLGLLEGQKHVVLFSQGFSSELLHGGGGPGLPDPNGPSGFDGRALKTLQTMWQTFQSAGVFLDAVDIVGLREDVNTSFNNDSLQMLAHGTGGDFVQHRNDFASAVSGLTKRQQVVYLLGFDRHDLRGGKILVRVHGVPRGARISYRQAFGEPVHSKEVDSLQLADIVVNDLPQTGVSMSIDVQGPSLMVAIARSEIIPQLVESQPWIETILYVFDRSGAAVMAKQKRIEFDAAARKNHSPIVIGQRLALPPGDYVAKAVTRIGGTTSVGFARTNFKIE